jgi:hypothetical protein
MTNEKKPEHNKHDKKQDDRHKASEQTAKSGMSPARSGKPTGPAKK